MTDTAPARPQEAPPAAPVAGHPLPGARTHEHLHNFPTRDGTAPAELRRLLRAEVERYPTVVVRDARVSGAELLEDGVRVTLEGGERIDARRVVLAHGVRDTLPAIDGLAERFGVSAFTCPYCDGYEAAGRAVGLVCTPHVKLAHATGLLRMVSDDVRCSRTGFPSTTSSTPSSISARGSSTRGSRA